VIPERHVELDPTGGPPLSLKGLMAHAPDDLERLHRAVRVLGLSLSPRQQWQLHTSLNPKLAPAVRELAIDARRERAGRNQARP
jgi:hypothetical protein